MSDLADSGSPADSYCDEHPHHQGGIMQWIAVATPPFAAIEQFDQVMEQLGADEPAGLQARYVGSTGDGLRVVTLWESKEHADRFFADRLGPAFAKVLGPEPAGRPEIVGIAVARSYTRQPVG
jgi:hypothetical protein